MDEKNKKPPGKSRRPGSLRVTTYFESEEVREVLRAIAFKQGHQSLSRVVRQATEAYVKRHKKSG